MKNVYLISDFASSWKQEMFSKLRHLVMAETSFVDKNVLMLGHYLLAPYDYDAIIVVENQLFIVEFKKDACKSIHVSDAFAPWYSEQNEPLWAGKKHTSSYKQSLDKRNHLHHALHKRLGHKLFIKSFVLYQHDVEVICHSDFDIHNHKWFFVESYNTIIPKIEEHSSPINFSDFCTAFDKVINRCKSMKEQYGLTRYLKTFEIWLEKACSWML